MTFDDELDLRGIPCPENAAKAILQIAMMSEGETLLLLVDPGEAFENVTRSVEVNGHTILEKTFESMAWKVFVKI